MSDYPHTQEEQEEHDEAVAVGCAAMLMALFVGGFLGILGAVICLCL